MVRCLRARSDDFRRYRELRSRVVISDDRTEEQFRKIHEMVLATSPNFDNITRTIRAMPEPTVG